MPHASRTLFIVALVSVTPAAAAILPAPAEGIGPGSHLIIDFGLQRFGCTGGWIFQDASGAYYLSTAGHCLLEPQETSTHGADADVESDARVIACIDACAFGGQTGFVLSGRTIELGEIAYARQRAGGEAIGSDFGLIRIPPAREHLMRPGLPQFGEATRSADMRLGDSICYFGTGLVTGETFVTQAREGIAVSSFGPSWRMAGTSNIGDSGAAVMDCSPDPRGPAAAGILTHLQGGLIAGTSMARARQMAAEAGLTIQPYL